MLSRGSRCSKERRRDHRDDGVVGCVVDTGILSDHPDLQGRLGDSADLIDDPDVANDGDGRDDDGFDVGDEACGGDCHSYHGTHVAGTMGASTDNNIICTDEKETIAVASITDALLASMGRQGAYVMPKERLTELEKVIFTEIKGPRQKSWINKALIGKNASVILAKMGISVPDSTRLIAVEVDENHPLIWTEQMMPVMPVTRVPNANRAIELAVEAEGGNRHTAVMHSKNLDNLSKMAKACDCSIFVKNGRSQAGLGLDGEGYCSFTIASPTGDGMTGPHSFSRWRRCVVVGHFRIT
jgi:acyl-CoA reductase-like NAD-dependent aldehyde dehydrogenase